MKNYLVKMCTDVKRTVNFKKVEKKTEKKRLYYNHLIMRKISYITCVLAISPLLSEIITTIIICNKIFWSNFDLPAIKPSPTGPSPERRGPL